MRYYSLIEIIRYDIKILLHTHQNDFKNDNTGVKHVEQLELFKHCWKTGSIYLSI